MKVSYKGFFIRDRKSPGYPYFYALVGTKTGMILGRVERNDEGGIKTREKAIDLAKHEIDQGYFLLPNSGVTGVTTSGRNVP
jgi:hypothetical protein